MAWKRYQVSNGHNTLDNEELEPDAVSWVLSRLKTHFGLRLQGGSRVGMDLSAAAGEIRIDDAPITLGWDNWSGFFLMAHDDHGDAVLHEIELQFNSGEVS
ncbi:MAG: hypothetical protein HFF51_01865 [Lawsonibacter sp.]|nr:hypothetical protein [Lawsonibacter sp.]